MCGLQYFGSSDDISHLRLNKCKCSRGVALGGGTPKQNYFHHHFLSKDRQGLLGDCKITFIDNTDSSDPTRKEFFWMTFAPRGLIICDIV